MEYDFNFNLDELNFLKSRKIVRNNLINKNPNLLEKIDNYSKKYCVNFNEVVYLCINNITREVICQECYKNKPAFISTKAGYKKYCSTKCSNNNDMVKYNKEKVCLEKWGVNNPSKSEKIKNKLSEISKNQSENTKEKRKNTCLSKFGYVTNLNIPETKKKALSKLSLDETKRKRKESCLEKYGTESVLSSDIIREDIKKTNLLKYGFEHPMKSEVIKEKSKKTSLENWGVDNPSKSEEIKEKRKISFLENWGVDHPMKSEVIKEKSKNTSLINWGVTSPMKSDIVKKKIEEVKIQNWGFKNNNLNEDFRKKNYKISNDFRYIKYTGNGISQFCCEFGHRFELSSDIYSHRNKEYLCHVCYPKNISYKELELYNFIKLIYSGDIIQSYRDELEIDIYLPELKLGFEFNGLYWHSEEFKERWYHINKTKYFENKGIRIVHIWEDDWVYKKEIIKSQISNWLRLTPNRIFARNCEAREIDNNNISKQFLNENHIQGGDKSIFRIGLFHNNELISIMTFDNFEGRNKMENCGWNLSRFCNKIGYNVVGGASKLLSYFITESSPKRIISYADASWSSGDLYFKLGFNMVYISDPDYKYVVGNRKIHKSRYRKSITGISESKLKLSKIWDCGKIKFEFLL